MAYRILSILCQWDYRQNNNVDKWIKIYGVELDKWYNVLTKIDELSALATFSFNNPTYTFPSLDPNEEVVIKAKALGHPLMKYEACVTNDLDMMTYGNFIVVTGANMAGKSTYLRMIGVNFLLALIGAPVFAKSMTFTPVFLFTGLRTTDSLQDNESYFFAELRRLQSIIQRAQKGEHMLVILDEILKGTNSVDKQKGSMALVKKLVELNITGIIATHDLTLGTLTNDYPDKISNSCFEAKIEGDKLSFTYKIQEGIASNMNAYFLMQHMGIV